MAPTEEGWSDEANGEPGAVHPPLDRRVTVVIPTRNRQQHLLIAVRSALDQVGVDVRVLVADQASTDGTEDAIRRLADPRVEIIRSERCLPPAVARNVGLTQVDTPWVAFLDDDDIWAPDRLRSGLEVMSESGADWCATGSVQFLDPSLRICGATRPPDPDTVWPGILRGNRIPGGGSGVLARTSLVRGVGGFREDIPRAEDWEMWIRLARSGRLAVVDRPMVAYRLATSSRAHQASTATNRALQDWLRREYGEVMRQTGVFPDFLGIREYEAWMAARAGRRWQASLDHLHLAAERPDLRHLLHAVSTALAPGMSARRRDRRALAWIDPEWVLQGQAIIERAYDPAPQRQPTGASCDETRTASHGDEGVDRAVQRAVPRPGDRAKGRVPDRLAAVPTGRAAPSRREALVTAMSQAAVTVIIPAHNEERVLARCLTSVRANLGGLHAQLVVVCNACTDRTADVARQFDGVQVVELAVASKAAALDAGDRVARFFPRLYLDADVEFLGGGPDQMRRQLEHGGVLCVTPTIVHATEGSSRLVRAFYRIWTQLPYRTNIPVGGAYMLSDAARERFADFPAVIADDLFVQSLFSVDERARDDGSVLRVYPPRTVRGLLSIRTRTYRGNRELERAGAVPSRGARPLADLLSVAARSPGDALAGVVYLIVNVVAMGLARWKGMVGSAGWERDQSSRTGPEDRTVPEAG